MEADRAETVHAHLPRFSQAVTGVLCLEGFLFRSWPVVIVALALILLSLAGPRWSPVAQIFRRIAKPPENLDPAAPVRFSQFLAAGLLTLAVGAWLAGRGPAGWLIVSLVAAVSLISAVTGTCMGCEVYRLILRKRNPAADLREALGLDGDGPWLVLVTASGCERCEPVARQIKHDSGGQDVVRVDLARTSRAARAAIKSIPALLAVGSDGRLRASRSGRLTTREIAPVLAALGT